MLTYRIRLPFRSEEARAGGSVCIANLHAGPLLDAWESVEGEVLRANIGRQAMARQLTTHVSRPP